MDNTKKAVMLTRFMFSTPTSLASIGLLMLTGALFGVLAQLLTRGQVFDGILLHSLEGIFLITTPAILSALALLAFKNKQSPRRVFFLSAVCALVYAALFLASIATRAQLGIHSQNIIFIAFGITFVMWFLIAKFVFNLQRSGLIFAIIQALFNAIFLSINNYIAINYNPIDILLKTYFAAFVFLAGAYAAFWVIDAPMKRNFGISATKAITLFLGQWLSASQDLEETFDFIGEDITTYVAFMSFKAKSKHVVFAVPYVHYGPFGNLGGSEFSYRICEELERRTECKCIAFHGTANHDFDPVSHDELGKIAGVIEKGIAKARHEAARASYAFGRVKSAHAQCFRINNTGFFGLSRAPLTTEDIDFGVGTTLMTLAEKHVSNAIMVDQHNSETGDITYFGAGNPASFEYLDAVEQAAEKAGREKEGATRIGFARAKAQSRSIGSGGIKTAAIEIGGHVHFIVVSDSNGVTPEFREKAIEAITRMCRKEKIGLGSVEVYTTDTHQLNMVRGVLNPLGSMDEPEALELMEISAVEAYRDLEAYEFASGKERVQIKVFGPSQSTEIISTVNSIWAIARIAIPVIIIAALALIVYGLSRF
ncbi:MAG: DUF2070 family protein [Candidatus Micrarchaeia archaeon]